MAQNYWKRISLGVSRRTGDEVLTLTADGKIISKAMREEAMNTALGKLYENRLFALAEKAGGLDLFFELYPEYKGNYTYTIIPNGNSKTYSKLSGNRKIIAMYAKATTEIAVDAVVKELKGFNHIEALHNTYSNFSPSAEEPGWYETRSQFILELGGTSKITAGTVEIDYLIEPVYQAIDDTSDPVMPEHWIEDIIQLATEILLKDKQQL